MDGCAGNLQHQGEREVEQRCLLAGHVAAKQGAEHEVQQLLGAVAQPLLVERRVALQPLHAHVEQIERNGVVDVVRINETEPFGLVRENLQI